MSRPTLRRVDFNGLPVNIEIEVGDKKTGVDARGQAWEHTYLFPYGEIAKTEGHDGDPVDVYLGPKQDAEFVYVIHQNHQSLDGIGGAFYDEDKAFLGFEYLNDALDAYYAHGPSWGCGGMTILTLEDFRDDYLADPRGPRRGLDPVMFGGNK